MEKLWTNLIEYIKNNNDQIDKIYDFIPEEMKEYFNKVDFSDLISIINANRSMDYARSNYNCQKRINSKIHYFKAKQSMEIDEKLWRKVSNSDIIFHYINGNHYNIVKKPLAENIGKIFDALLT